MLRGPRPVDAVLFASNRIAAFSLKYLQATTISIPADLCIVAFDENEAFDFFHAPLSFIRQPLMEMGKMAMDFLLQNMAGKSGPERIFLPAELVIRESSTPSQITKNYI